MANVRVLEPASVPTSFRVPGVNTYKAIPSVLTSDIPDGHLMVLSSGKVAEAALSSEYVDDGQLFYALTAETWHSAQRLAGSVPFQQFDLGIVMLTPGVFIEVNVYTDGDGDADDTLAQTDIGATVTLHVLPTSGIMVADKTHSTSSLATFTVVKLVDPVGTIFGRVLVAPTASFKYPF